MVDRLLEFVALLRKNGVRVSTAETLDAIAAAELVGIEDREALAGALSAAIVKRASDQKVFDELFDLYFFRAAEFAEKGAGAGLVSELTARGFSDDEIQALLALLADEAARLSQTARAGLGLQRGGQADIAGLVRGAGATIHVEQMVNPLQVGFFSQQVLEKMQMRQAEAEIAALVAALERKLPPERAQALGAALRERMGRLRQAVRQWVADEFDRRNVEFRQRYRQQILEDKPFSQMDAAELARLRAEVDRLARKLREQAARRPQRKRRGRLDARRTLRRAFATGGIPFDLRLQRRRKDKPRLVVLCDISDSVRNVSRFMLQFAYALQDQFAKVRSFVFVSDLGETTELFAQHELQRALQLASSGAAINVYANSNFGRAFTQFRERYLESITPRTTVIVIGDGRNNYFDPAAWALADVRARARRVLWLNPEPRLAWNFGDSVMRVYEPHCDRVEVVNNLSSLRRVVDELVL